VLDFDATDDPVHGRQEGRFFHGYYDRYCFLPLYVFCGSQPLVAANTDAARGAWLVLKLLVERLRAAWPEVRIIWRADSGFCRWRMLRWSERHGVDYLVGLARNTTIRCQAFCPRHSVHSVQINPLQEGGGQVGLEGQRVAADRVTDHRQAPLAHRRLAVANTVHGKPVRTGCLVTLSNRTLIGFSSLKINELRLS
jgi:hypothetical protein